MNKFQKLVEFFIFYIRYPDALIRTIKYRESVYKKSAAKLGAFYMPPNYTFFINRLSESSVVVDVGCGYEAELSQYLARTKNMKCFMVDPTKKHESSLKNIQDTYPKNIKHLKYAVASENSVIDFHETLDHESGSLLIDHQNVLNDNIRSYKVKTVTIEKLIEVIGCEKIDLLKIDIEGAEFELFDKINFEVFKKCAQIFIEFHHISVKSYSFKDTRRIISQMKEIGLKTYTVDKLNYLFYW